MGALITKKIVVVQEKSIFNGLKRTMENKEEEICKECGQPLDECGWSSCGEHPEDI